MSLRTQVFGLLAVSIIALPRTVWATPCTFTTVGETMTLNGDCTTDSTIVIPDGFTLDGAGHTITAVDPVAGHFLGAVVRNGGARAAVTNLSVTASGLINVCDAGADRLRASCSMVLQAQSRTTWS